jgi:hypothetical protein
MFLLNPSNKRANMDNIKELRASTKETIYSDLSRQTGVSRDDVAKVMEALGIESHQLDSAIEILGDTLALKNVRLGFKVSHSTVAV